MSELVRGTDAVKKTHTKLKYMHSISGVSFFFPTCKFWARRCCIVKYPSFVCTMFTYLLRMKEVVDDGYVLEDVCGRVICGTQSTCYSLLFT